MSIWLFFLGEMNYIIRWFLVCQSFWYIVDLILIYFADYFFFFGGGGYLTQKDQPKVGILLMFIYHVTIRQSFEHKLFNDTDNNVIDTFYIWNLSVTDADSQRFTKLNNLRLFPIIYIKICLTLFVVRKHSINPKTKVENLKNLQFAFIKLLINLKVHYLGFMNLKYMMTVCHSVALKVTNCLLQ